MRAFSTLVEGTRDPPSLPPRSAVETIGSEFMAVSGLPSQLKHHANTAYAAVVTAVDMQRAVLLVSLSASRCPGARSLPSRNFSDAGLPAGRSARPVPRSFHGVAANRDQLGLGG